jgi:hypothetical protein
MLLTKPLYLNPLAGGLKAQSRVREKQSGAQGLSKAAAAAADSLRGVMLDGKRELCYVLPDN